MGFGNNMKACTAVIPAPYEKADIEIYKETMAKKWAYKSNFKKLNYEVNATEDGISKASSPITDTKRPPDWGVKVPSHEPHWIPYSWL